jgi:hypothetical protein
MLKTSTPLGDVDKDDLATKQCACYGARRERVLESAKERLGKALGAESSNLGFDPTSEEVHSMAVSGFALVSEGAIHGFTINLPDSDLTVKSRKTGGILIDRKRLVSIQP